MRIYVQFVLPWPQTSVNPDIHKIHRENISSNTFAEFIVWLYCSHWAGKVKIKLYGCSSYSDFQGGKYHTFILMLMWKLLNRWNCYTYLGTFIRTDWRCLVQIITRIIMAKLGFIRMKNILANKKLLIAVKGNCSVNMLGRNFTFVWTWNIDNEQTG